jgi:holo-[acyl-carrier protein] synthase
MFFGQVYVNFIAFQVNLKEMIMKFERGLKMIVGIGNDLIEIDRVRKIIQSKAGARFLERILTPAERELAKERRVKKAEFTAGRFAAKEAIVKALGCGIGEQFSFQDMEIKPDSLGKPNCSMDVIALERMGMDSNVKVHISISHTDTMASAFAVIEKI